MDTASAHPVGSIDAWLVNVPNASSSEPMHVPRKGRQSSPFAAIAHAARSASPTEPVPIPRRSDQGCQSTCSSLPAIDPAGAAASRSRRFTSCSGEDSAGANGALTAASREATGSDCGKQRSLVPAASLPVLVPQAPVSLESLCTALSSPASHATLAAAGARQAASKAPASTAAEAAATAAAAAAFARSLAWDPEAVLAGPELPDCTGTTSRSCCGGEKPRSEVEGAPAAEPSSLHSLPSLPFLPPIDVRRSSCNGAGEGPGAQVSPVKRLRTKRGLYEGTVRGGSPRNTWQHCAAGY